MANEIQTIHGDGAETVYAIVRHMDGKWYDAAHTAWDTFVVADWADYDIALAEVSAGDYNVALQGTFPAVAAGFYWLDFYVRAGATAAQTDWRIESILYYWDGTSLPPAETATWDVTTRTLSADTNINYPTSDENATAIWAKDARTLTADTNIDYPSSDSIADAVLKTDVSDVQDTAGEHSLTTMVLAATESSMSGSAWTIRKTTGDTFTTKTVTSDTDAKPIVGVT